MVDVDPAIRARLSASDRCYPFCYQPKTSIDALFYNGLKERPTRWTSIIGYVLWEAGVIGEVYSIGEYYLNMTMTHVSFHHKSHSYRLSLTSIEARAHVRRMMLKWIHLSHIR